jgi:UDP-glucose 4-epimerase
MSGKRKIMVTGGLGYIGSHTVIELISAGFEVAIIDDLSNSSISVLDDIKEISGVLPDFYQLDLKNEHDLTSCFIQEKFDAVIHFAASKSVGESTIDPMKYYENNIGGMVNLIKQMNEFGSKNIVFSSSCTVYGQPDQLPVSEETPIKPAESSYGNTKKVGEDMLRDSSMAYDNFNAIALRYFNPVGAHPSGKIGERSSGIPNNLMPFLMQTVTGQREFLNVFGSDYDTPDGTAIRDYIHVIDLAKAHVIALNRQLNGGQKKPFEYFNLGSGNGYSVLEIIQSFEKVNGVDVNYKLTDRRPGDIEKIYADNALAKEELGWQATLGLDEMMSSSWRWQRKIIGEDR